MQKGNSAVILKRCGPVKAPEKSFSPDRWKACPAKTVGVFSGRLDL
jgi:hypothetical protein